MGFCPEEVMEMFCVKTKEKNVQKLEGSCTKIKGRVVLKKKGVLDFHDIKASILDRVHELLGKGVSLQLISAVHTDPGEVTLSFSIFLTLGHPYQTLVHYVKSEQEAKGLNQTWHSSLHCNFIIIVNCGREEHKKTSVLFLLHFLTHIHSSRNRERIILRLRISIHRARN